MITERSAKPTSRQLDSDSTPSADDHPAATSFKKGFIATLASDVISKVIGGLVAEILVRNLTTSNYAFLTLFLTISGLLSTGGGGGVRQLYLRKEAEEISRGARTDSNFIGCLV